VEYQAASPLHLSTGKASGARISWFSCGFFGRFSDFLRFTEWGANRVAEGGV
jgi:hypothetical protein